MPNKIIKLSIIFLLLVLWAGCQEKHIIVDIPDPTTPPDTVILPNSPYVALDTTNGFFQGICNEQNWVAQGYAKRNYHHPTQPFDYAYINATAYTTQGYARHHMGFEEIPLAIGNYPIGNQFTDYNDGFVGGVFGTLGADGDLIEDFYYVLPHSDNEMTVTLVDTIGKRIEGHFTVWFYRQEVVNRHNPDTFQVRNCYFRNRFID